MEHNSPERQAGSIGNPLLDPLYRDMVECERLLENSDCQFARRTFVRASFAFLEGQLHWFRNFVFEIAVRDSVASGSLNVSKLAALLDIAYRPNHTGVAQPEQTRVPFLNFCALVMRTAAEHSGVDPALFFSDNGWDELRKALAVRHRITHPKKPEHLDITDSDLKSAREGHRWFCCCLTDAVNGLIAQRGCPPDLRLKLDPEPPDVQT